MSWLAPLGFLGLIGLIALVVIYIIKPNYQNKVISSTFIWRLSLKYKKKRIPISRLHNILLFVCQCLILTLCALLLAKPAILSDKVENDNEKVIILDASASMLLKNAEATRFVRAVEQAKALAENTLSEGGTVSVILADSAPLFLAQRVTEEQSEQLDTVFDGLLSEGTACTYGSANMEEAFALAEQVLKENSEAEVYLYTATTYIEKNGIRVENVADPSEWNVAVLDCTAEYNADNHYEITVDVGCFGKTELVTVNCKVHSPNGKAQPITVSRAEFFDPTEEQKKVVFSTDDFAGVPLYSFDYLEVYVSVGDAFPDDNSFLLYGGTKQTIRVQYASSIPNNFFAGIVRTLRESMKGKWDIKFVEVPEQEVGLTEGFDFYIFEHRMPEIMPNDGVVLLVDPDAAPRDSGLILGDIHQVNRDSTLASGVPHKLMNFVDPGRVTIAKYSEILSADGYEELAFYQGNPVVLLKDTDEQKVVVWAFDLNYSNLIALPDFSFMIYNLFNHFIPSTMSDSAFAIGDTVELTPRGTELKLIGNGEEIAFEENYGKVTLVSPGTYTVTQKSMAGNSLIIENFFVKIPTSESNVTKAVDALPYLNVEKTQETAYQDLLFYFAIALVAFMFIEWYLQTKKNY